MSIRLLIVLGLTMLLFVGVAAADEVARYEFAQPHMGTEFVVRLYAATEADAEAAAEAAFARIAELDGRLSDYQSESELSRLSRSSGGDEAVRVSDDLWIVLSAARRFSEASDGAFDVTVGPYVRLWRRARRTGQLPTSERLAQAREAVGYRFIELDAADQSVRLVRPNMRLDLGAIAKGYAADKALAVLRNHGIPRALVSGGGDMAIGDPPPGEPGWRIAIAPLRQTTKSSSPPRPDLDNTPSPPPPGRGRGSGGGGEETPNDTPAPPLHHPPPLQLRRGDFR
jgi:thiamine biosynthesis lipoprotein